MKTELNIKPECTEDAKCNEVVIREGRAIELREPKIIVIEGDINSVSEFLKKRYPTVVGEFSEEFTDEFKTDFKIQAGFDLQNIDATKAVVIVDKEEMNIEFLLDPQNYYGAKVKASLEFSKELGLFHINEAKEWTREELIKLFRFNRLCFTDAAKAEDLVKAFQKFSVKSYVDLQQENDTRGNASINLNKTVTTGIPTSFALNIPIFKGQPKKSFSVDICLEAVGSRVNFWFESVELVELIETHKEEIFKEQLDYCKFFPIINK